jgi:hypothetical protein
MCEKFLPYRYFSGFSGGGGEREQGNVMDPDPALAEFPGCREEPRVRAETGRCSGSGSVGSICFWASLHFFAQIQKP